MTLLTMTDFIQWLAHCFETSFHFLKYFNRNVNILLIIVGAIGLIGWLWKQMQYNRKAEEQGMWK